MNCYLRNSKGILGLEYENFFKLNRYVIWIDFCNQF